MQLLETTEFELRTAASGHDCLDLWASAYRPDVIFMDPAMAGIDGCETLRRIRRYGPAGIRLAIVSANAFDKGIDNDVGIHLEDFILKPVRHTELIDWLERILGLRWCHEAVAPSAVSISAQDVLPDAHQHAALLKVINLGFYRGRFNKLADIEKRQPATAAFMEEMRLLGGNSGSKPWPASSHGRQPQKESGHEYDALEGP